MATEFITRDRFCNDLAQQCPVDSDGNIKLDSIERVYDLVFDQLAAYLRTGNTRVYLPMIGTVYRSVVPANPQAGLPERLRYRLSCKPFIEG
jgi:hypothetical protein